MKISIDWDDISLNKFTRQELVNYIGSYLSETNINELIYNGDVTRKKSQTFDVVPIFNDDDRKYFSEKLNTSISSEFDTGNQFVIGVTHYDSERG